MYVCISVLSYVTSDQSCALTRCRFVSRKYNRVAFATDCAVLWWGVCGFLLSCTPAYVRGTDEKTPGGLVAFVALLCLPVVVVVSWYAPVLLQTSCPYDMATAVARCGRRPNGRGYASVSPLRAGGDEFEDGWGNEFKTDF